MAGASMTLTGHQFINIGRILTYNIIGVTTPIFLVIFGIKNTEFLVVDTALMTAMVSLMH